MGNQIKVTIGPGCPLCANSTMCPLHFLGWLANGGVCRPDGVTVPFDPGRHLTIRTGDLSRVYDSNEVELGS